MAAQNLSVALVQLYNRGGGSRSDAMRLVGRLHALETKVSIETLNGLSLMMANVLLDIYLRWHLLADLKAANALYRLVGRESASDWSERAMLLEGLANSNQILDNLIANPYLRLERAHESVAARREVLDLREDGDVEASVVARYQLASDLRLRGFLRRLLGDDGGEADTSEALELLAQVHALGPPADLMPDISNIEGLCWKDRRETHPNALDKEITAFENAVSHRRRLWAERDPIIDRNLGNALAERAIHDGNDVDVTRAFELYAASAEATRTDPGATALTTLNWLAAAVRTRRWGNAIEAGESALATWFDIAIEQALPADTFDVVHSLGTLGRQLASAYLETGQPLAAAAAVDRTHNAAAAILRHKKAAMPVSPASEVPPARELDSAIAAIRASAEERTLCYLIATQDEVTTVLVNSGSSVVSSTTVPERGLGERLAAYLRALDAFNEASRRRQLNRSAVDTFDAELHRLGRWVGDTILRSMLRHTPSGTPVALIPTGHLGLIPFQIAQIPDDLGQETWLVDRHRVSISYSSTRPPLMRPARWLSSSLLLVANPGHDGLPAAGIEGEAIRAAWPGPVSRPVTTVQDVRDRAGSSPLHFACHASFNQRSPLDSALHLRDGSITVGELVHQNLDAPLAFLGACSTGQSALSIPDETISLGHAFAIAGVREVVSTTWPVYDVAAAAVATSFYEHLCESGLSVAESLRRAQQDVRDGAPPTGRLTAAFHHRLDLPQPLPLAFWGGFTHATR